MAARCAAGRGRRTLLLERNRSPGLKILISGGGRCNLTTTRTGRDLEDEYGPRRGTFLRHALRQFPPARLVEMFEDAGVPLREEDLDKVFPCSQRARDILDALLRMVGQAGAVVRTGTCVSSLRRDGNWIVETPGGELRAESVVLATGGLSYPKTGSRGDGHRWLLSLGHTLTRTVPALAPILVEESWVRELSGIVLPAAEIAILDRASRVARLRRRPILFTHFGLSGPAPMDLSGDIEEQGGRAVLEIDFVPDSSRKDLEERWLEAARTSGRRAVEAALPPDLPERLRRALASVHGVRGPLASVSRADRRRILDGLKATRIHATGTRGFAHAEVTRGGVELSEVDARTMGSLVLPGLFLCGEILDVDGPIGGFNFQAAFATGRLAGLSA
ncbi:MAG: aminoacetone oxidase family FAD-binding enzyme [Planctomycetota bacterium]